MNSPVKFWPIIKIGRRAWPWRGKSKATAFLACNSWLNFRVWGQFEIKILIVRVTNTSYFLFILKKIELEPATIWKLVTYQGTTSKRICDLDGSILSPRYGQVMLVSGYPVLTAVNWSQHGFVISGGTRALKLARKCEIKHWFSCGAEGRVSERCTVTWLPNFLGWIDLFGLWSCPRACVELRY